MSLKIKRILSDKNTNVKKLISDKENLFFFEGEKIISDLFQSGIIPELLIIGENSVENFRKFENKCKNIWHTSDTVIKKISSLKTPPGSIAIVKKISSGKDFYKHKIIFAIDKIQDPGNMGTIFRCAAAFGIRSIALTGDCTKINNPKFLRASQNSLFHISVKEFKTLEEFLKEKNVSDFNIYMTSPRLSKKVTEIKNIKLPAIIVIGNEGKGINESLLEQFNSVSIPQSEIVESLNAGVSGCILMNKLSEKFGLLNISD